MNYRFLFLIIALSFINCEAKPVARNQKKGTISMQQETINVGENKTEITSDSLNSLIRSSLFLGKVVGNRYEIDVVKEKALLSKIASELKKGSILKSTAIIQIVERDGSGENQITSQKILKLLIDNYKSGSKKELLDTLLIKSIITTDASIVAYLIEAGAKPRQDDITAEIQLVTPDYSPDYQVLKLLVEKLKFDLYKNCNITLIWWLVLEAQASSTPDLKAIQKEINDNPEAVFLKCNSNKNAPFFDADFFPTDKSAYDLGISSENILIKSSFKGLKNK